MNEIKIFESMKFGEIRTTLRNDEPWFVAADVCRVLEIQNPTQALDRLDDDERAMFNIGRQGDTNIVNEPGLYTLVLGSRKPEAREFKRWITHEVIPAIRQHGMYATPQTIEQMLADPDTMITTLQALKAERTQRLALEAKIEQDAPKVLFANSVESSQQSILIGELAKLLKQNGVDIGQNRLFGRMRKDGYLCATGEQRNLPTQRAMDLGILEIKKRTINNPDGSVRVTSTTKVTGKGQIYFINKYRTQTA